MKKGAKKAEPKININKQAEEENKQRILQANKFESYIQESGLTMAFQLIFSELVSKQVNTENYFSYVSIRLREIGKELDSLKSYPDQDENKDNENHDDIEMD
jgi:hypothetical protein